MAYTDIYDYSRSPGASVPVTAPGIEALGNLWQYYQQIAQKQYDWAQGEYAKNSQLTDNLVNDYLGKSQMLTGMGASDLSRYQGIFQPIENQLVADAASYAGAPRIAAEMGRAGATAAQAGEAGRQNALADLRAYGIDPSAGRYADLDRASRMQEAASVAGAQNQARLAAEATGRGIRSEAIQVGQRYPGQIANELSSALAADTGAINARLANANTGANLFRNAVPWAQLAQQGAEGQVTAAQRALGTGGGTAGFQVRPGSGGGSGGGGGGTAVPGSSSSFRDPGWNRLPSAPSTGGGGGYGGGGGGGGGGSAAGIINTGWQEGEQYGPPSSAAEPGGGDDWSGWMDNAPDDAGWGNWQNTGPDDYGMGGSSDDWSGWMDSGDEGAAAGGAINPRIMPPQALPVPQAPPMGPTSGGFVNQSASPSAGIETDDVPARLNAHEYVIPRDVALWHGRKFYQSHIDKAREEMGGATAKPKMKPALNAPPTFRSQAIPGAM